MGWSDPNWRWGSAIGEAHDLAMALRSRLGSEEVRQAWLEDLVSDKVDVEDLKLALGLRIQHAARQGMDGQGAGWQLMQDMVACKYEGPSGEQALRQDLLQLGDRLPAVPPYGEAGPQDSLGRAAARALTGMGFIAGGL
mmetsp:Transcript_103823/g.323606  ORF Transcript_103823/g.323606 Transcript_103823/m.323606 type:complete len:139 (-) Transcript_103823:67-483(-)